MPFDYLLSINLLGESGTIKLYNLWTDWTLTRWWANACEARKGLQKQPVQQQDLGVGSRSLNLDSEARYRGESASNN
jgi:hypothetical protein